MNEQQFGNKIRQALNEGARLQAPVRERLRAARERALAGRRAEPLAELSLAGNVVGRFGGPVRLSVAILVPLLLLAIGLASLYSGQKTLNAAEKVEIDTQLLADELPIDAYLDKGFEAWLKKQRGD